MELVDVYDKHNNFVRTQLRFGTKSYNEFNKTVHAYIINDKNELLIQKRSDNKRENPGKWEAVGGAVAPDEDSLTAITREIKEEINKDVDTDDIEYIGTVRYPGYIADVYVLTCNDSIDSFKILEEEVSDIKWATLEDIDNLKQNDSFYSSSFNYFKNYYWKHLNK